MKQQTVYAQLRKLSEKESTHEKNVHVTTHKRRKPYKGRDKRQPKTKRHSWALATVERIRVELKVLDLLADKLVLEQWDDMRDAAQILRESASQIAKLISVVNE
jgi:hypothetical protein